MKMHLTKFQVQGCVVWVLHCFSQCYFIINVDKMKTAKVIPLHKGVDMYNLTIYRTVSLLQLSCTLLLPYLECYPGLEVRGNTYRSSLQKNCKKRTMRIEHKVWYREHTNTFFLKHIKTEQMVFKVRKKHASNKLSNVFKRRKV